MARRSTINGENQEPAFMQPLRGIGGLIGILRAHVQRARKNGEFISPAVIERMAVKFSECYTELWEILVDDKP